MPFALPGRPWADRYSVVIDTTEVAGRPDAEPLKGGTELSLKLA